MFWSLAWIQLAALASLIAFRLPLGDLASTICQWVFYMGLALVGSATLYALAHQSACWICPAICLGVMIVVAACEPASGVEGSEAI